MLVPPVLGFRRTLGRGWYAVLRGREGPKVYESWEEARKATDKYPGAEHKRCATREEAEGVIKTAHTNVEVEALMD